MLVFAGLLVFAALLLIFWNKLEEVFMSIFSWFSSEEKKVAADVRKDWDETVAFVKGLTTEEKLALKAVSKEWFVVKAQAATVYNKVASSNIAQVAVSDWEYIKTSVEGIMGKPLTEVTTALSGVVSKAESLLSEVKAAVASEAPKVTAAMSADIAAVQTALKQNYPAQYASVVSGIEDIYSAIKTELSKLAPQGAIPPAGQVVDAINAIPEGTVVSTVIAPGRTTP